MSDSCNTVRQTDTTLGAPARSKAARVGSLLRAGAVGVSVASLVFGSGCTTLGPMPTVTGQAVSPEPRAGVDAQVAAVPGYFLSSAVSDDAGGAAIQQGSLMLNPEELLDLPGFGVGGRVVGGGDGPVYGEPMLRYRTYVGDDEVMALGGLVYGTKASGSARSASFDVLRLGGEFAMDLRVTPRSRYLELHLITGVGLLGLDAEGSYCQDTNTGYGVDCDDGVSPNASAEASGLYPTLHAGLNLDFARHLESVFHGARLSLLIAGGQMPQVRNGAQTDAKLYTSGGAALTLMFGGL